MNKLNIERIHTQWDIMIHSGRIPVMEYEMFDGDYLVVDMHIDHAGINFTFDESHGEPRFDGEITTSGRGYYSLPFDEFVDDLDVMIQTIDANITDGYLSVYDLQTNADE